MNDIVQRLQEAACEAIANEQQALRYEPNRLRGITVELTIGPGGSVIEGRVWVERKAKAGKAKSGEEPAA